MGAGARVVGCGDSCTGDTPFDVATLPWRYRRERCGELLLQRRGKNRRAINPQRFRERPSDVGASCPKQSARQVALRPGSYAYLDAA